MNVSGLSLVAQAEEVASLAGQINMLWVVIGAILVIFMQAGFALVETGFSRAKHAAHVVSTNFAIFGLGFIGFFLIGFPLSLSALDMSGYFGGYGAAVGSPLIGDGNWIFLFKGGWALSGGGIDAGVVALFIYMVAFMDTSPRSRRGRWPNGGSRAASSCGASSVAPSTTRCSPLDMGRWLAVEAGTLPGTSTSPARASCTRSEVLLPSPERSCSVHASASSTPNGKPRTIAGHHIPMAMLGTFILLFGWFGFNAASELAADRRHSPSSPTNTTIAGAFGAIVAMVVTWFKAGKPDAGMMANGMLAGLVAITAVCLRVQPDRLSDRRRDRRRHRH